MGNLRDAATKEQGYRDLSLGRRLDFQHHGHREHAKSDVGENVHNPVVDVHWLSGGTSFRVPCSGKRALKDSGQGPRQDPQHHQPRDHKVRPPQPAVVAELADEESN